MTLIFMEFRIVLGVLARTTQEKEVKKDMKGKWGCQSDPVQGNPETKAPSPEWSSLIKANNLLETELRLYLNWGPLILYHSDAVDA